MVSVRLEGRLGNQLFQYAFIYSAAKALNTPFYPDQSIEPFLAGKYFKIKSRFWFFDTLFSIKGFKNLFSYHLRRKFYSSLQKIYQLKPVYFLDTEPAIQEIKKITDQSMNIGFFQSENYFLDCRKDIKQLFSVRTKYREQFETVLKNLPATSTYIAIHVRRTDYVHENLLLPSGYYHNAIKNIHNEANFYILVSDDPDFTEQEFSYLKNKYVSRNSAIIDLQFLMAAEKCILSNSSFSWWGAYLNYKNASVIAPKFWSGKEHEYPKDILMQNWTLID
jgi:hypothetical protein